MTPDELRQCVDTIVVVMMENRSFDHVLGHLSHRQYGNRAEVRGIADPDDPQYRNPNLDGLAISPFWMDDAQLPTDLPHDSASVATQLAYASVRGTYNMNGFVRAFERQFHTSVDQPATVGLLRPQDVPATGALAAQYTVCDNWFACLPTSTAPNRLMSMCGESGLQETQTFLPDQQTVYDWLSDRAVRWRVYTAGIPFLALMKRLMPLVLTTHFRSLRELRRDLTREADSEWPRVIFIEPDYFDAPVHFPAPCDNHPPLPIAPGERFLRTVYSALTSHKKRWSRTVLVVTYDEHGGFFDHVAPPRIKYRNAAAGVSFDSTGPRTPTIVAGPYAPRGVCHEQLDNTSILQLLAERFGKPHEPYSPAVDGRRQQGIASVSSVLDAGAGNAKLATVPLARVSRKIPPPVHSDLRAAFHGTLTELMARHRSEALAKYPALGELPDS